MNCEHRPSKVLITGTSGSGKTTYYIECIRQSRARFKFIFDHEGELGHRLPCSPALSRDEMDQQTAAGVCVFDPAQTFPGRLPESFLFFCDYSFTLSTKLRGPKLFCCDELQKLVGTETCPRELATILDTGRRHELDLVCISQSPNLIHTRIRNQLTEVVTFRQVDERAVKFLEEAGFNADQVRGLPPGQYLARNLNTGAEHTGIVFKPKGGENHARPTNQRAEEQEPGRGANRRLRGGSGRAELHSRATGRPKSDR